MSHTFADQVRRDDYQRVINQNFPGFRILAPADFDASIQKYIIDGEVGTLLVGHFNYDNQQDFVASIIGSEKKRYGGNKKYSYDYYDGKLVTCYGKSDIGTYSCHATNISITLPVWSTLDRVAPGAYECYSEDPERKKMITTEIDSVGSSSEKGASFDVINRDGSTFTCVTAD